MNKEPLASVYRELKSKREIIDLASWVSCTVFLKNQRIPYYAVCFHRYTRESRPKNCKRVTMQ